MRQMQCALSTSSSTFHAAAFSYDTGLPRLDTHSPPGMRANPCARCSVYSEEEEKDGSFQIPGTRMYLLHGARELSA
jgi:hypothetical protein